MLLSARAKLLPFGLVVSRSQVCSWLLREHILNRENLVEKLELLLGCTPVLLTDPQSIVLYQKQTQGDVADGPKVNYLPP